MAFKRTNFTSLVKRNNTSFKVAYSFSKKVGTKFEVGSDAYIIPLGLETGYYETPCHRIKTHKAPNGEIVGFKGSTFDSYIKCKGIDSEGNKTESVCCILAQKEKTRIPDKENSGQRIISSVGYRMHLPVLILGNSLTEAKKSYPVSKVSILNDLRSEAGLKFAYLEMSSSTFGKDIVQAYGNKLREDGVLDYDLAEDSEEFLSEVISRLPKTIIKVHGVSKTGFNAAMKEYTFFSFDNPSIASASPAGEKEAILGYQENQEIQNKICEFLDLFNVEVDNMFTDYSDKELIEYYNSAIGIDIHTPLEAIGATSQPAQVTETVEVATTPTKVEEKVEVIETPADTKANAPISDENLDNLLDNIGEENEETKADTAEASLEEFEFDSDEDDFFEDEA